MNDIFIKIIENSEGVFEDDNFLINPVAQIKLKDVSECTLFIRVDNNKLYVYPFQNHPYTTFIFNKDSSDVIATSFAQYMYKTKHYTIKFKPLTYSLSTNNDDDLDISNEPINIYSSKDIPKKYYTLSKNTFNNIGIVSHLLYRRELNDYINSLKTNSDMDIE